MVGKIEVGCQQKCDQHVHERSRKVNILFATCPEPHPATHTHTAINHVGIRLHRSQGQSSRLHKYVFSQGKDIVYQQEKRATEMVFSRQAKIGWKCGRSKVKVSSFS